MARRPLSFGEKLDILAAVQNNEGAQTIAARLNVNVGSVQGVVRAREEILLEALDIREAFAQYNQAVYNRANPLQNVNNRNNNNGNGGAGGAGGLGGAGRAGGLWQGPSGQRQ